ncbi:MAG: hypothetical protein D4R77_02940 [Planctomycetaceae bacterium]|nr:MAG: hypothetical protein D4R77_02940 [Planctomycetaceae bacterium]
MGTPFFFDVFLSTEQGRATDCLSKRCLDPSTTVLKAGQETDVAKIRCNRGLRFNSAPHSPTFLIGAASGSAQGYLLGKRELFQNRRPQQGDQCVGGGTHTCNTGQDQLSSVAGCGVLLSGDSFMIRGVKFLFDQRGKKTAVMIDLRQGRGLWEDILDVATARLREREPSENWSTVRGRLEKAGRLKKGRRRA